MSRAVGGGVRSWAVTWMLGALLLVGCRAPRRAHLLDGSSVPGPAVVEIIAHRGVHDDRPGNTLPAIERAIELGLDYVEIDVRQSRDGTCVLMHDRTVDATTDGTGYVWRLSGDELRALDAGCRFGSDWTGVHVPTLDEALAAMSGRIGAYVDVKSADARAVIGALQDHGMVERALVYSGDVDQMLELEPRVRLLPEYPGEALVAALVARTGADTIAISSIHRLTPEAVAACHAEGARVFVDLMKDDSPEGVAFAVACGVDGIQTDRPEMVQRELQRLGRRP